MTGSWLLILFDYSPALRFGTVLFWLPGFQPFARNKRLRFCLILVCIWFLISNCGKPACHPAKWGTENERLCEIKGFLFRFLLRVSLPVIFPGHLYSAFIQSALQRMPLIHPHTFTHQRQLAAMQGTNQLVRSNWGIGVLLKDTSTRPGWDRTGNPPTARRQLLSHIAPILLCKSMWLIIWIQSATCFCHPRLYLKNFCQVPGRYTVTIFLNMIS